MSCYVYCLYSTENGRPRYVGRASDKVSYRFKQHVAAALDKEPGALYDWMRDVWRRDKDVAVYTLQEGISPKDLDLFEQYWIEQFPDLLNVSDSKRVKTDSKVAKQIMEAIRSQLELSRSASEK
jgi:hypothetical protein